MCFSCTFLYVSVHQKRYFKFVCVKDKFRLWNNSNEKLDMRFNSLLIMNLWLHAPAILNVIIIGTAKDWSDSKIYTGLLQLNNAFILMSSGLHWTTFQNRWTDEEKLSCSRERFCIAWRCCRGHGESISGRSLRYLKIINTHYLSTCDDLAW